MNRLSIFTLAIVVVALSSCSEDANTPSTTPIPDSTSIEPARQDDDTLLSSRDTTKPIAPDPSPALRIGSHFFTLHWISWERPGMVNIELSTNGRYRINGSQRDRQGNFITINGEIEVVTPLELKFSGVIQEKVRSLNKGDTCTREGEQIFLSTKNRKYWRLQNMTNCERSGVVDYIDIYF